MPTTLTTAALDVAIGARTLVTALDLVLADGDVTALVGPNGSGKSTLMRTLVGQLPVVHGEVRLAPSDATVGWLPQQLPDPAETLLAYVRRRTGVADAERELHQAASALGGGGAGADDRYAGALERWLALGAADLDARLPELAASVGLDVDPARLLGSLSGGQAARASLVAVLASSLDVLLLDEPTNNLDARGLDLVVDFVRAHSGPVLVASHDRHFLDAVATGVVELDLHQQRVSHYTGGWTAYAAQAELARRQAWQGYEDYAQYRDRLLAQSRQRHDWAERGRRSAGRDAATRTEADKHIREKHRARADRQAARGARLERAAGRLAPVDQPRKEWQLRYRVNEGAPSADVVATLADAVVEREAFRIGPVTLELARGDRVGVHGDNGSGKSTLLAALLGRLPLAAGRSSLGARVEVGVLDQDRSLLETDRSLLDVALVALGHSRATGREWDSTDARTLLAKFGLGAEHVGLPARSLSMGERTRALMAVFQGREVNTLVLDEPTNHLDVAAIEQLEAAVAAFTGTVVVVTHDRRLAEAVGLTRSWHVADGSVRVQDL
jgi:ATPase subunit of ABC transporter with duplicated ATPase domains